MAKPLEPTLATPSTSGVINSLCPPTCQIYYKVFTHAKFDPEHAVNVVMIHGLACPNDAWWPQIEELLENEVVPLRLCVLDNRGIGRSSVPTDKALYSTTIMAEDVIAVMDHLGWQHVHLVGFSMGAMISCKVAVKIPDRIRSLALLGIGGGGFKSLPHCWRGWKYAVKGVVARTPHEKALIDIKFHFSKATLKQQVLHKGRSRREELLDEYVNARMGGEVASKAGIDGQMAACWTHKLRRQELKELEQAGFPILIAHGRYDALANPAYAERLASQLGTVCIMMDGAHFIPRECRHEVNSLLLETLRSTRRKTPLFRCTSHRDFR